jgi:hypothetical protein
MPRDMRAIVDQLQLLRPPVSNLRDLCALTRDQLAQVLLLSRAVVSAQDFHRAIAAISSADNSMQMLPPSPPSSAAAASSSPVQPLNLHEQLPFFVYGTLCSGFRNYKSIIEVTPQCVHLAHDDAARSHVNACRSPSACKPGPRDSRATLSSTSPTADTRACLLRRPICCLLRLVAEMWRSEKYLESLWMPAA